MFLQYAWKLLGCFSIWSWAFLFPVKQPKGKNFIWSGFLRISNHTMKKENVTKEVRLCVRHLLKSVRHQLNMQPLYRWQTYFELGSYSNEKRATDSCWSWKIWHVFYAVAIWEKQKISRWERSVFKCGVSKGVQGRRHSWWK